MSSWYIKQHQKVTTQLGTKVAFMSLSINFKNSLLMLGEKVLVLGITFLNGVLLARFGGVEIFGQYSFILSFAALFSPLCVMGVSNVATKYFVKHPQNSHYYYLSGLIVRLFGSLLFVIAGSTCFYLLGAQQNLPIFFTLLLMQGFVALYLSECYFLAIQKAKYISLVRVPVFLILGLAKMFVILNSANINTLILLTGAEYVFIGLGSTFLYFYIGAHQHKKRNIKLSTSLSIFHKSKWLLLSGLAAAIYLKIDQVMLGKLVGNAEVGIYSAATKLSEFWYIFPVIIANAYNPSLIKKKHQGKSIFESYIIRFLSILIFLGIVLTAFTFTFSDIIIKLIYGEGFEKSAGILSVQIFALIFVFQRAVLSKWLVIENLYRFSLLSHGSGAVFNIALNFVLIPLYGSMGAAWATLFSYIFASFLCLYFFRDTRVFFNYMCKAMFLWPKEIAQLAIQIKTTKVTTK